MVDIASISAIIAATSVVAGVIYYNFQIRHQTIMRQTDLTTRLYIQHIGSKEFMNSLWQVSTREEKDYNEYVKKYGGTELLQISVFFEGIGYLLHRKLLDIDMAKELFGEPMKLIWEKNEPILKEMHADACFWFEYLYNEMQKREQRLQQIQQ